MIWSFFFLSFSSFCSSFSLILSYFSSFAYLSLACLFLFWTFTPYIFSLHWKNKHKHCFYFRLINKQIRKLKSIRANKIQWNDIIHVYKIHLRQIHSLWWKKKVYWEMRQQFRNPFEFYLQVWGGRPENDSSRITKLLPHPSIKFLWVYCFYSVILSISCGDLPFFIVYIYTFFLFSFM